MLPFYCMRICGYHPVLQVPFPPFPPNIWPDDDDDDQLPMAGDHWNRTANQSSDGKNFSRADYEFNMADHVIEMIVWDFWQWTIYAILIILQLVSVGMVVYWVCQCCVKRRARRYHTQSHLRTALTLAARRELDRQNQLHPPTLVDRLCFWRRHQPSTAAQQR